MYFVYILQSEKDSLLYIGYTENIQARLLRHQSGEVPATQTRRPLKLISIFQNHKRQDGFEDNVEGLF